MALVNPTLIPDPDISSVTTRGELSRLSKLAAQQAAESARVAATAYVTVGGVPDDDDTVTASLVLPLFTDGQLDVTVVADSDTAATLAAKLKEALRLALLPYRAWAEIQPGTPARVNIFWPGPVGNSVGLLADDSGGAATLTASAALLAGGSGMIVPLDDVQIVDGLSVLNLRAGYPIAVSSAVLAQLVAAGALIS